MLIGERQPHELELVLIDARENVRRRGLLRFGPEPEGCDEARASDRPLAQVHSAPPLVSRF